MTEQRKIREIKKGAIHCFSDCGYDCKKIVREKLEAHYLAILSAFNLPLNGWRVETWHNSGWHAVLKHDESGFMLSDAAVSGGIEKMHRHPEKENAPDRFGCYNYDTPEGTTQIWVYAATPWQAIGAVIREAQKRITGYRGIIGALAPHGADEARAADLYGATPANGYTVADEPHAPFTCERCGKTTTHPEGWHYCHTNQKDHG